MDIKNPFRATLGASPPVLVGRSDVIEDFHDALQEGPGAHERISLLVGPRGIGKTALLNELEDKAKQEGWIVIAEDAVSGFAERLRGSLQNVRQSFEGARPARKLSVGFGGLKYEVSHGPRTTEAGSLRDEFGRLFSVLDSMNRSAEPSAGIMVTLDELHYNQRDEIVEFAATIQHLVREDRNIAVAIAGIPASIRPLLASDEGRSPITFLRRANRIDLGKVSDAEVELGLRQPLEATGARWEPEALKLAVEAADGYPFMIQLIGHWAVRRMTGGSIDLEAARDGIAKARRKLGQLVHEPALDDLSDLDRSFLVAMSVDDGKSKVSEIAKRLDIQEQQAYNYRARLVEADMVVRAGAGYVDFSLPYLREYLRDHVAAVLMPGIRGWGRGM